MAERDCLADHTGASAARVGEVFIAFLKLGLTSFGGPIAHLGYYRAELVTRRRWLGDETYADLVALCQFLPGPTSSQVGVALGLMRVGWLGALAAFAAFTLPSALIMSAFALTATRLSGPLGSGALAVLDRFYRAGALVFGGGHVVLPGYLILVGALPFLGHPASPCLGPLGAARHQCGGGGHPRGRPL